MRTPRRRDVSNAREWRDPAFREGDLETGSVCGGKSGKEMNIGWQKGTQVPFPAHLDQRFIAHDCHEMPRPPWRAPHRLRQRVAMRCEEAKKLPVAEDLSFAAS